MTAYEQNHTSDRASAGERRILSAALRLCTEAYSTDLPSQTRQTNQTAESFLPDILIFDRASNLMSSTPDGGGGDTPCRKPETPRPTPPEQPHPAPPEQPHPTPPEQPHPRQPDCPPPQHPVPPEHPTPKPPIDMPAPRPHCDDSPSPNNDASRISFDPLESALLAASIALEQQALKDITNGRTDRAVDELKDVILLDQLAQLLDSAERPLANGSAAPNDSTGNAKPAPTEAPSPAEAPPVSTGGVFTSTPPTAPEAPHSQPLEDTRSWSQPGASPEQQYQDAIKHGFVAHNNSGGDWKNNLREDVMELMTMGYQANDAVNVVSSHQRQMGSPDTFSTQEYLEGWNPALYPVAPTRREGPGLQMGEAMAHGFKPIIEMKFPGAIGEIESLDADILQLKRMGYTVQEAEQMVSINQTQLTNGSSRNRTIHNIVTANENLDPTAPED